MIEIFDCEQGSPEWIACRLGIPTASEFDAILANGKGGQPSKTRRTYMLKLIGERLTGEQMYSHNNDHMERGKVMEAEARDWYAFATNVEPQRVGFIRNSELIQLPRLPFHPEQFEPRDYTIGCSPDSLVGDDGLLEIKTKLAHLQADVLLGKELPPEHKAQVQGQLWVAERQWVDFVSYWPKMPPFRVRVYRDEEYIKHLSKMVDIFCNEIETLIAAIREAA